MKYESELEAMGAPKVIRIKRCIEYALYCLRQGMRIAHSAQCVEIALDIEEVEDALLVIRNRVDEFIEEKESGK